MKNPARRLASALGVDRKGVDPQAVNLRRIDRFLEQLERTPFDTLRVYAVQSFAPAALDAARRHAQAAADEAGRMDLRLEAAGAVDAFLRRALDSHAFDPTYRAEPLRPDDRARLRRTLVDASLALVSRDLIDDRVFDELAGPCAQLMS